MRVDPTQPNPRPDEHPHNVSVPADQAASQDHPHVDRSVWLIWAGIMLVAIAVLPFAVRNQDVVRAIARMCGFDID